MRPRDAHIIANLWAAAAGLIGIAVLFLPFTWGVTPLRGAIEGSRGVFEGNTGIALTVFSQALPAFLSLPILAAAIRQAFFGPLSRSAAAAAYVLGTASTTLTAACYYSAGAWLSEVLWSIGTRNWFSVVCPVLIFLVGAYLAIGSAKSQRSREFTPVIALEVPYLADATLCLLSFPPGALQIGAYCTIVVSIMLALHLLWIYGARDGR